MKAEAGGPSKATAGLRIAAPAVDQTLRASLKYCKMSSPVLDNYVERHNHLRTHVRVFSGYFNGYSPSIYISSTNFKTELSMFTIRTI